LREYLNRLAAALRARGLALLKGVPQEQHELLEGSLSGCRVRLAAAQDALRNLERVIGTEIGKRVVEHIGFDMSKAVRKNIMQAVYKARQKGASSLPDLIELQLSSSEVAWLDPDALERRVLEEWKYQTAPKLRAFVDITSPIALEQHVTVLDVRVPELGYRHHIARFD
jgi:hypothetical protein